MDHAALTGMMEILLVEDNLEDARLTMQALKQKDVHCRVHLVCDGDEAWDFLHAKGVFARAPLPEGRNSFKFSSISTHRIFIPIATGQWTGVPYAAGMGSAPPNDLTLSAARKVVVPSGPCQCRQVDHGDRGDQADIEHWVAHDEHDVGIWFREQSIVDVVLVGSLSAPGRRVGSTADGAGRFGNSIAHAHRRPRRRPPVTVGMKQRAGRHRPHGQSPVRGKHQNQCRQRRPQRWHRILTW